MALTFEDIEIKHVRCIHCLPEGDPPSGEKRGVLSDYDGAKTMLNIAY